MMLARLSDNIGKGLVAGLFGTAVMTVSSTVEAKLRDRPGSTVPADAASAVLGIQAFEGEGAEQRFSQLAHWGYGTGWGAVRGLLRTWGLRPATATVAHLGALWGTEQAVLPTLGVSPPATEWGAEEVAIDLWHHVAYVIATALAYEWLDRAR